MLNPEEVHWSPTETEIVCNMQLAILSLIAEGEALKEMIADLQEQVNKLSAPQTATFFSKN